MGRRIPPTSIIKFFVTTSFSKAQPVIDICMLIWAYALEKPVVIENTARWYTTSRIN